jgi:anti-sigma factor RsiW
MNCQEFRRKLLEEPTCSEKAFLEHAARCAECNREHRHALQFEAELFRAMHVEPPANLESRIRQKIGASEPSKPHARHLPWLAAAAGLILLLGAAAAASQGRCRACG